MKVLMISSDASFFEPSLGGDVWARHLAYAKGVDKLFIVVKTGRPDYQLTVKENITAVPVYCGRSPLALLKLFKTAVGLIGKEKIDLINAQDPLFYGLVGYWLKRKFKLPLILNWHGDFLANSAWLKERPINYLLLPLAKYLSLRADAIRVVSVGIKDKLVKIGVVATKIRVIPTPVDLAKFSAPAVAEQVTILRQKYAVKKIILFVGRLVTVKNLAFCLRAMPELLLQEPNVYFLIAGDGPLKPELQALTQILNLSQSVEFLDAVSQADLLGYYQLSACLVLPSKHESFGKVILEAAMQNRAVLASKTTGAVSIIKNANLLFEVDNSADYLAKLTALLTNEERRLQLATELRLSVTANYGWEKSVSAIIKMWHEVIKQ